VKSVTSASVNPVEASFEPIETKAIRIMVSKLRPGEDYSRVFEIEAYEK
jgi:hypothetical protein